MQAFFLPAQQGGRRFCVYFQGVQQQESREKTAWVFVPPFAEEMNKARHVVAQAARRLSEKGDSVLLIDLHGTGDSDGGFEEASWQAWSGDIHLALSWLRERGHARLGIWGMRMGALLGAQVMAEDFAGPASARAPVVRCLWWQAVTQGELHVSQFLRMRLASAMINNKAPAGGESVRSLRAQLNAGEAVEVAGYTLTHKLTKPLDGLVLDQLVPHPGCQVDWLEVLPEAGAQSNAGAQRVAAAWAQAGCVVKLSVVQGQPFWSATSEAELVQCPELVSATCAAARPIAV